MQVGPGRSVWITIAAAGAAAVLAWVWAPARGEYERQPEAAGAPELAEQVMGGQGPPGAESENRPPRALDEPAVADAPSVVAEEAAGPPRPSVRDFWIHDVERTAELLFEANVSLEELARMAGTLLEQPHAEPELTAEGKYEYRLEVSEELGSASLLVQPGLFGEHLEFELVIEISSPIGAVPHETGGSRYAFGFGLDDGHIESFAAVLQAHTAHFDVPLSEHEEARLGAALNAVAGEQALWYPWLGRRRNGDQVLRIGESIPVNVGALRGEEMDRLASRLAAFRP